MTLLLDTHAWIWWVDQDRRLGAAAIAADHSVTTSETLEGMKMCVSNVSGAKEIGGHPPVSIV